MDGDSMTYFHLVCFMICYLGVLGLEALNNGWLIKYGEKKRRTIRKTLLGVVYFSLVGVIIPLLIDIFL